MLPQAVLRGHLDDLAGHHVVLKVAEDSTYSSTGFNQFMRVDRAPLLATRATMIDSNGDDPAVRVYMDSMPSSSKGVSKSTTWGVLDGWLRNLASNMRVEQAVHRVDELHPTAEGSGGGGSRDWSCPLKRLSFWTKVSRSFSPLVPSPARSARLFGNEKRNMLHGTRSHPTQKFASLYDRLADVSTSNGFCYCVDVEDCMVPSSAASQGSNQTCTLLDTIRSMYDGKFRSARLLTQNDPICTQQLDWPFVGGTMRDGSVSPPRYGDFAGSQVPTTTTAGETCNVIDRLPVFQYR